MPNVIMLSVVMLNVVVLSVVARTLASDSSAVVEQLTQNLKFKGSYPAEKRELN
jgi:hypothetical protein